MGHDFTVVEIDDNFHSKYENKRDCFLQIMNYINNPKHEWKICAVCGLRRTGKTTLLEQAAAALPESEKKKAVYIKCLEDVTDFYHVIDFIYDRLEAGYKYFFIDELTYCDNYFEAFTSLSDNFVNLRDAKIVTTGTNSLGFHLASKNVMYDRIGMVDTTYTSFPEYARLTGIYDMDEFIKRGCVLVTDIFETKKSTDRFTETAIVKNIYSSMRKYEDAQRYSSNFTQKYTEKQFKCEVERIINRYSQTEIHRAITSVFRSAILGDARQILSKTNEGMAINRKVKYDEINKKIAEILGCDELSGISDDDIKVISGYVKDIGVYEQIPVYNSYNSENHNEPISMMVHPGMFHANVRYTLEELMKDSSWINADEKEKSTVLTKAYESAMEKIMENIVISNVFHMLCCENGKVKEPQNLPQNMFGADERWYVSKLSVPVNERTCEADLIIVDKRENRAYLFEIKHSRENVREQSKHLENYDFLNYVEENIAPIGGCAVLYSGATDGSSFVPRISVADFLTGIYKRLKQPDMSVGMVFPNL